MINQSIKITNALVYSLIAALLINCDGISAHGQNASSQNASAWYYTEDCARAISTGGYLAVVAALKERLTSNPRDINGWLIVEQIEEALGHWDLAINAYDSVVSNCPDYAKVVSVKQNIIKLEAKSKSEPIELSKSLSPSEMYLIQSIIGGLATWSVERFPLKIYISPSQPTNPILANLISITHEAFVDWSNHSDSKVSMIFVKELAKADIVFEWTKDKKNILAPGRDGYTSFEWKSGKISRAYITCLMVGNLTNQPISDSYARHLSRHEIGHALGLGHSIEMADIMFALDWSNDANISPQDQKTLVQLYAESPSELYQKASSIYEHILGPQNPSVVEPLFTYGRMLYREHQYAACAQVYSMALDKYRIIVRSTPSKEGDTGYKKALQQIAWCYEEMGKNSDAEKAYKELLEYYDKRGEENSDTAYCIFSLARLDQMGKRYEGAVVYYRRACSIYKRNNIKDANSVQCQLGYEQLANYLTNTRHSNAQ